jgi:hypothetical protein
MAQQRHDDRKSNTRDQQHNREQEHPQRPDPELDRKESVGGANAAKAEEDARNKSTRRGDR